VAALAVLGALTVPAAAGILPAHPDAYDDGVVTWSGATPFVSGDLAGTIEWAVFTEEAFPFDTGGAWTPTPDELVYVYQVYSTGADYTTSVNTPTIHPAGNAGAFEDAVAGIVGIAPNEATVEVPGSAYFGFPQGIVQGENSQALVFSSPNVPMDLYSIVVNGGSFATASPIPTPSAEPIPEPTTLTLMILATATCILAGLARRRRA